jgi:hypothetical protein
MADAAIVMGHEVLGISQLPRCCLQLYVMISIQYMPTVGCLQDERSSTPHPRTLAVIDAVHM